MQTGAEPSVSSAYAFATAMGFELRAPRGPPAAGRCPCRADQVARLRAKVDATAYDVLTWTGACPEEHLDAFCEMHTRMSSDVPVGEIDYEPVVIDAERLRAREERVLRSFDGITAVARRRADGVFGGYSQLYLPHGEDYVYQDDTLVMPEHRGHRLGTLAQARHVGPRPARLPRTGGDPHRHRRRQPRDAGHQPRLRLPSRSSGCTRCSAVTA